jgi:hypothetical protein
MIEAGILGKPVHTILADEFAGGQQQTLHFHYLRASHGGLVHDANGVDDHIRALAQGLRSGDADAARCRAFVERFARPRGIDAPVAPIVAEEIERTARMAKRPQAQPAWSHAASHLVRVALASRRALGGRRAEARA